MIFDDLISLCSSTCDSSAMGNGRSFKAEESR